MKKLISFILCLVIGFVFLLPTLARSPDAEKSFTLTNKQIPIEMEEIQAFAQTEVVAQRNQVIITGAESNNRKSFVGLAKENVDTSNEVIRYESPPLVTFNGFGVDARARAKI